MPKVMAYASIKTEKIGSMTINDAIKNKVINNIDLNNLFIIIRNNNDDIVSIDYNTVAINEILTLSTSQIEDSLNAYEMEKGIYFYVPTGISINNSFLSSLGPRIPVKLELVGSVVSSIKTNITNYGINNALMEVNLELTIKIKVIIPFISQDVTIKSKVPLIIKMINGKVPSYYLNGYLNTPTSIQNM